MSVVQQTKSVVKTIPVDTMGSAGAKTSLFVNSFSVVLCRITAKLQAEGTSLREMSRITGYSRASLWRYCSGKTIPPRDFISCLWDQFDISQEDYDELLTQWETWSIDPITLEELTKLREANKRLMSENAQLSEGKRIAEEAKTLAEGETSTMHSRLVTDTSLVKIVRDSWRIAFWILLFTFAVYVTFTLGDRFHAFRGGARG